MTRLSVDIENLYPSVLLAALFRAVRNLISEPDEVKFQSGAGITNDYFLMLLEFYLGSTAVKYNNELFIQKSGTCVGSSFGTRAF